MIIHRKLFIAAALTLVAGGNVPAQATVMMSLSDGTHTVTVDDSATPGIASFSGAIGNFTVSFDIGTGFPAAGSPDFALIDLGSLDLTSNVGGTLTISLTETGFAAKPNPDRFYTSMTGNFVNSHATLSSYLDTGNAAFGTGVPLASGLLDNAAGVTLEPALAGPYSLTEIVTVSAGAHSLTSLDAIVVDAPEPASLPLLGTALLALAMIGLGPRPMLIAVRRRA